MASSPAGRPNDVAASKPIGLGLQLSNKTPKRRVNAKLREDRRAASRVNDVWAMDFVHDQLATGPKVRVLTVVDTFSRLSSVLDPRFSYCGKDVVQTLERTCAVVGYPRTIRVDQGSEFISRDQDLWAYSNGITLDCSRPGKPTGAANQTKAIGLTLQSMTVAPQQSKCSTFMRLGR